MFLLKLNHDLLKPVRSVSVFLVALFALTTSGFAKEESSKWASESLTFGSKTFTESYVLGELLTLLAEKNGAKVKHKQGLGGTLVVWEALKAGSIDAYPEYTGTIAEAILKDPNLKDQSVMRERLLELGIGMSKPIGFNNTYAIVTKRELAERHSLKTLSDLANFSKENSELTAGFNHEFINRKDGWRALADFYGIQLPKRNLKAMDHSLAYVALKNGSVDLKEAYSTDAKLDDPDYVTLKDDQEFFPEYKAVILYRLDREQILGELSQSLEGRINESEMIAMNARAEEVKNYKLAAKEFLGGADSVTTSAPSFPWQSLYYNVKDHLFLVLVSMFFAIFIGIPMGIYIGLKKTGSQLLMSLVNMAQTIPALALFAILIPLPGLGLSVQTALLALVIYSLLPVVRNTAVGLESISSQHKEMAQLLRLTSAFQMFRIYLPMASPIIFAGIKTAVIINIGTATLAALIGSGGLGEPILSGINLNDTATLMRGALPAAGMALVAGALFFVVEKLLIPKGLQR